MLVVCPTPIGNLEDVTLRVLRELAECDVVLCEDTRHTRVLLGRHEIQPKSLVSYHRMNEAARTAELLPRLQAGERMALVSDAGLPGVNDPGRAAHRRRARARDPGHRPARAVGGRDGARRERPRRRALRLRRLPAARRRSARPPLGRARRLDLARGRVRVAEAPAREPGLAGRVRSGPSRRRLPRADEEVRGGRPRPGGRGGEAVLRSAEGRDHAGRRPRLAAGARRGRGDRRGRELVAAGFTRKDAAGLIARLTGVPRNRLYKSSL